MESCLELMSDHTPILITIFTHVLGKPKKPSLHSKKKTDWNCFRETLDEHLTLTIPLKAEIDTEAVENINKPVQKAAWQATRDCNDQTYIEESPITIQWKLAEKRKACKSWQLTRAPQGKQRYN